MVLLNKLTRQAARRNDFIQSCLQTLRFRAFLKDIRTILTLFEDGREKINGDYILDFHYVESLVEKTIRKLGAMVYDACVLMPEGGEALYETFDRHRNISGILLDLVHNETGSPVLETGQNARFEESEYAHLDAYTAWLEGVDSKIPAVRDCIRQALNHVLTGPERLPAEVERAPSVSFMFDDKISRLRLLTEFETAGDQMQVRSVKEIECRPLSIMLSESSPVPSGKKTSSADARLPWVASVGYFHLSLRIVAAKTLLVRVETAFTGNPETDYLFIFADSRFAEGFELPPAILADKTPWGLAGWGYNLSPSDLEASLKALGKTLFCHAADTV